LNERLTAGGSRREKNLSVPLAKPARELLLTGRSVSRVGATGIRPCTSCPPRSVFESTPRCAREKLPRMKSSVETRVMPPRTLELVRAACKFDW
jgi:hypothetical protein